MELVFGEARVEFVAVGLSITAVLAVRYLERLHAGRHEPEALVNTEDCRRVELDYPARVQHLDQHGGGEVTDGVPAVAEPEFAPELAKQRCN
jgi:hypothetical protein